MDGRRCLIGYVFFAVVFAGAGGVFGQAMGKLVLPEGAATPVSEAPAVVPGAADGPTGASAALNGAMTGDAGRMPALQVDAGRMPVFPLSLGGVDFMNPAGGLASAKPAVGAAPSATVVPVVTPAAAPAVPVVPVVTTPPANVGAAASNPAVTPPVALDTGSSPPATVPAAGQVAAGAGTRVEKTVEPRPIEKTPIRPGEAKVGGENTSSNGGGGFLSGTGNAAQVGAALAIVIGLILIGRTLARKFIPGAAASNGKGVVEILARHPLSKNQSIVLLRIGSQIVALNQGKEASQSVLVISDAQEVARIIGQIEGKNPNSISAGFNKLLSNARVDLEREPETELREETAEGLDEQLEEMAAAKRQLMELRQHVRSVRDSIPRS